MKNFATLIGFVAVLVIADAGFTNLTNLVSSITQGIIGFLIGLFGLTIKSILPMKYWY